MLDVASPEGLDTGIESLVTREENVFKDWQAFTPAEFLTLHIIQVKRKG